MKEGQENSFVALRLRKRELVPVSPNQYRIVTAAGEVRQIEALTAYEAFIQSGFKTAVKIERVSNLDRSLIGRQEFIDERGFNSGDAFSDVTPPAPDSPEAILLHRNPILSAEQLGALMKTLAQAESKCEAVQSSFPSDDTAMEPVVVPAPAPSAAFVAPAFAEGIVPGPTGLDVHGDGFDEIIPQAMPLKPQTSARHTEPTPQADSYEPAPALPPARELTEAEVEKLLGGK